ncbi:thiol:disulfide interchange protein DsbA/DsbL [Paraglaciecola aestuariivivens]
MRFTLVALSALFISLTTAAQSKWQEGTHYIVIAEHASAKQNVKEVFSYWCPACNAFETLVPQIKSALPDNVPFEKVHVNFNGSTSKQTQNDATAIMLAAKALNTDAQFNQALFNAIHQKRKKIVNKQDLLEVYKSTGADQAQLEKMLNSFGIRSQVAKNDKQASGVRRVPTIIVNDKYQPTFTRDMTPDDMVDLISWLVKQK